MDREHSGMGQFGRGVQFFHKEGEGGGQFFSQEVIIYFFLKE